MSTHATHYSPYPAGIIVTARPGDTPGTYVSMDVLQGRAAQLAAKRLRNLGPQRFGPIRAAEPAGS